MSINLRSSVGSWLWLWIILGEVLLPETAPSRTNTHFDDAHLEERATRFSGLSGPQRYTRRLVVFGDSLSDVEGRLAAYTNGLVPPSPLYWRHRLSNGPLWIEYLASALSTPVKSYATAGARLTQYNNYGIIPAALSHLWAPPLATQWTALDQDGGSFDEHDWVFIWIGNNDFMFDPYPASGENYCADTLEAISQVRRRGATRLTIFGVADVSLTPFSRRGGSGLGIDALRELVTSHNRCLETAVRELQRQHPGESIDFVSLSGIANHIVTHPENYSLSSTEEPCLTGSTWPSITVPFPPIPPLLWRHFMGACPDQDRYFFWDAWHPNTMVHCISTVEVLKQLGRHGKVWGIDEDPASKRCF